MASFDGTFYDLEYVATYVFSTGLLPSRYRETLVYPGCKVFQPQCLYCAVYMRCSTTIDISFAIENSYSSRVINVVEENVV